MASLALRVIIDVLVIAIGCLAVLLYRLYGISYKRGFYCDDNSIRYPYKTPLISDTILHCFCILCLTSVVILNECWEHSRNKSKYPPQQQVTLCSWYIPPLVVSLCRKLGVFAFGAALCGVINNITKLGVGRLRPNFLDVCKPSFDCAAEGYPHFYVTNYTCTGDDLGLIEDARLSFPSGHALATAYAMVCLVLYIQGCVHIKFSYFLKPFVQFIFLTVAWYTALSRLSDNMHHWDDILAGIIIGAIAAVTVVYMLSDIFSKKPEDEESALYHSIGSAPVSSTGYKTME